MPTCNAKERIPHRWQSCLSGYAPHQATSYLLPSTTLGTSAMLPRCVISTCTTIVMLNLSALSAPYFVTSDQYSSLTKSRAKRPIIPEFMRLYQVLFRWGIATTSFHPQMSSLGIPVKPGINLYMNPQQKTNREIACAVTIYGTIRETSIKFVVPLIHQQLSSTLPSTYHGSTWF